MANLVQNIQQGGAKKAFAGTVTAVLSSQVVQPFIDWGFDTLEANGYNIPDPVEVSTSVIVIAIIGFFGSYFSPPNNIETERGLLVKPEDAIVKKAV